MQSFWYQNTTFSIECVFFAVVAITSNNFSHSSLSNHISEILRFWAGETRRHSLTLLCQRANSWSFRNHFLHSNHHRLLFCARKKIDEAFTYRFVHRGFVKIVGFYFQSVFVADYNLVYEIKISISALKIDHLIDSRDADQDTRNAPLCVLRSKAHWGEGTCLIALEKRRRHLNRFHRLWTNIVFTTSLMLFLYHVVTEWDCQFFLSV